MVLNKRSIEGSTNISDGVSLKNKHIHHYTDENEFYKSTNQESSTAQEPDLRYGKVKQTKGSSTFDNNTNTESDEHKKSIEITGADKLDSKQQDKQEHKHKHKQLGDRKKKATSFLGLRPSKFVNNRGLIHGFGVFMFVYYLAMMYVRVEHRGLIGIADSIWLCNLAVIFGFVSIFVDNAYIMNIAVNCTFIVHLLWVIDVVTYFATGSFPLGNAEYISWPSITWGEILTTTHHAWFVPMCMICLHRNGGYQDSVWFPGSMVLVVPVLSFSRYFPKIITLANGSTFYLNINMSHEWWSDMKGWPFSLIPNGTVSYGIFLLSFSLVLFSVSHAILKVLCWITIKK
ncbi:hypothetical protein CYY_008333 [Polysphondylium violaceum]|uniref:Transmembrane protein n=1 Tax=Polysphondylium violaceum TaxID=133409 RepID=A0A8J4PVE2_9MYCE|nr:hypothetical protein CYY_008333 [Polysphondylium violaceum]